MSPSTCPVMHGALTNHQTTGASNQHWWPNQLNLAILHQQDSEATPQARNFNYREAFAELDYASLKKDLAALMTDSQDWSREPMGSGISSRVQQPWRRKK